MKKVLLISLMALVLIVPINAFALILGPFDQTYQQLSNRPCVIGDMSCQAPAGWDYTAQPNGFGYDLTSPVYQAYAGSPVVAQAGIDLIPSSFILGIDMNFAAGQPPETIDFIRVFVSDTPGGTFTLDTANSFETNFSPLSDNGTGFSDAVLTNYLLVPGKYYKFEAALVNSGGTDGMEEYFLIPVEGPPPSVPEPATLLLMGIGLLGLGIKIRREK